MSTGENILALAMALSFDAIGIAESIKKLLRTLGFMGSNELDLNRKQFIATAKAYPDTTEQLLALDWLAYVFKTLYQVLRDVSDFRGILIIGTITGQSIIGYKHSLTCEVASDIESVNKILLALEPNCKLRD